MAALRDELMDLRIMLGPAAVFDCTSSGGIRSQPTQLPPDDSLARAGAIQHVSVQQLKRLCEHYADQVRCLAMYRIQVADLSAQLRWWWQLAEKSKLVSSLRNEKDALKQGVRCA